MLMNHGGFFTPDLSPINDTVPLDLGNFKDFNKNRNGETIYSQIYG